MNLKISVKSILWTGFILLSSVVQLAAESEAPTAIDKLSMQRSIDSYLQRLDELEEQYGAYEPELGEELSSLGSLYQQNGQHKEAVNTFKRQYQIARTNDGLYSLTQVDTLKKMITSLVALRDWEEVEKRHYFLQQLVSRNYPPNDLRKVSALTDMADWHMYAFNANIDDKGMTHLLTARNALAQTGSILAANTTTAPEQLADVYNSLLYTDYQVALLEQQSAVQAQSRAAFEQRVRNDFYNSDRVNQAAQNLRVAQNSFVSGVRHLEDLRNAYANNPNAPLGSVAKVDAQIGDWYSLWQKHNNANRYYQKAWTELANNPANASVLQETFGKPIRLLSFVDKYESSVTASPGTKQGHVLFKMDVTASGRVKNVSILENEPADRTREINRASQRVSRSRYRPRYENGVPVASENIEVRYVFEYTPNPS